VAWAVSSGASAPQKRQPSLRRRSLLLIKWIDDKATRGKASQKSVQWPYWVVESPFRTNLSAARYSTSALKYDLSRLLRGLRAARMLVLVEPRSPQRR
jgi:hypothetical protein